MSWNNVQIQAVYANTSCVWDKYKLCMIQIQIQAVYENKYYLCLSEVCNESFCLVVFSAEGEIFVLKIEKDDKQPILSWKERMINNQFCTFACVIKVTIQACVLWEQMGAFSREAISILIRVSTTALVVFPRLRVDTIPSPTWGHMTIMSTISVIRTWSITKNFLAKEQTMHMYIVQLYNLTQSLWVFVCLNFVLNIGRENSWLVSIPPGFVPKLQHCSGGYDDFSHILRCFPFF